jgi:hypothetical protein
VCTVRIPAWFIQNHGFVEPFWRSNVDSLLVHQLTAFPVLQGDSIFQVVQARPLPDHCKAALTEMLEGTNQDKFCQDSIIDIDKCNHLVLFSHIMSKYVQYLYPLLFRQRQLWHAVTGMPGIISWKVSLPIFHNSVSWHDSGWVDGWRCNTMHFQGSVFYRRLLESVLSVL